MPFALRPGPAPAVTTLVREGIDFTLHPFSAEDVDDGVDLAEELDLPLERVVDTVLIDAGGRVVACLVPAGRTLDDESAAAALGVAVVRPALEAAAERATGHPATAAGPIGHRRRVPVLVDRAVVELGRFAPATTVVVASGQPGLAVELALADLLATSRATEADLVAP